MKVLFDIKDSIAPLVMELLQNLSFIKTKTFSLHKAKVLKDEKEAVEEMKLVKSGKLKARKVEDLFYEL